MTVQERLEEALSMLERAKDTLYMLFEDHAPVELQKDARAFVQECEAYVEQCRKEIKVDE